jgi:hypothetical protein
MLKYIISRSWLMMVLQKMAEAQTLNAWFSQEDSALTSPVEFKEK